MATEKTRYYRLARAYWDGKQTHPRGTVLPFVEGKQPKTSSLLTDAEVADLDAAAKATAAIAVQLPEGFYDDVVAEVTAKVLATINQKDAADEVAAASKPASAEGGSTPADPKAKK